MHTRKQSSAPILDLPEPCDKAWDAMQRGEQGRRFCDSCSKHVYDLSSMTRRDALGLLAEHDWDICVNFEVGSDGQMMFEPEPPSRLQLQLEGARRLLAAAALVPLTLSAACDGSELRTGGEPVAVTRDHRAEALPPEPHHTDPETAPLTPGSGLEVTPPTQDDEPACDGIEEAEPTTDDRKRPEPRLERLPDAEPIDHPKMQRLGGAPRMHIPDIDTSPAPDAPPTPKEP